MALAARLLSIAHPVVCEQESTESLRRQVVDGLRRPPKEISPRWLFDERGSALFDRLCSVVTARSYKPDEREFEELVQTAGMGIGARCVDQQWRYGLYWLESPPAPGSTGDADPPSCDG